MERLPPDFYRRKTLRIPLDDCARIGIGQERDLLSSEEVHVLKKLMLMLAGTMLALTIALPASASSHAKPVKPAKTTSAHALCMQGIAQANATFTAAQRAATKALHTSQVAAKKALNDAQKVARKALKTQQAADLATFKAQNPTATAAQLSAFHDQQETATKALNTTQKADRTALHTSQEAAKKALHDSQKTARAAFNTSQEAAKKACPKS
jgi:hypothetical protein